MVAQNSPLMRTKTLEEFYSKMSSYQIQELDDFENVLNLEEDGVITEKFLAFLYRFRDLAKLVAHPVILMSTKTRIIEYTDKNAGPKLSIVEGLNALMNIGNRLGISYRKPQYLRHLNSYHGKSFYGNYKGIDSEDLEALLGTDIATINNLGGTSKKQPDIQIQEMAELSSANELVEFQIHNMEKMNATLHANPENALELVMKAFKDKGQEAAVDEYERLMNWRIKVEARKQLSCFFEDRINRNDDRIDNYCIHDGARYLDFLENCWMIIKNEIFAID